MRFSTLYALVYATFVSVLSFSEPSNAARNNFDGLDKQARDILARATPAAPHWLVYGDAYVQGTTGPPPTSDITVRLH